MDKNFLKEVTDVVMIAYYRMKREHITPEDAEVLARKIIEKKVYPKFVADWLDHLQGDIHPTIEWMRIDKQLAN